MTTAGATPVFPGATQCSRVSLYGDLDTGVCGGTPHVHTACTEAYVWLRGIGSIELLGHQGHQILPMAPDDVAWFSPGVIHRGIPDPDHQDAEVLVVMQNAGLPEAGDAVLTLPERLWGSPEEYRRTVDVSSGSIDDSRQLVRERRAMAMEGLAELTAAVERLGPSGLDGFYAYAASVVRPHLEAMAALVEDRVQAEVDITRRALDTMRSGSSDHLRAGQFATARAPSEPLFGMCGELRPLPTNAPHTDGSPS